MIRTTITLFMLLVALLFIGANAYDYYDDYYYGGYYDDYGTHNHHRCHHHHHHNPHLVYGNFIYGNYNDYVYGYGYGNGYGYGYGIGYYDYDHLNYYGNGGYYWATPLGNSAILGVVPPIPLIHAAVVPGVPGGVYN